MGGCCSSTPSVVVNPARVDMSHFELLKVVGKGGFGKVNACENRNDKRLYAIKTLKKSLLLTSEAHLRTIWIERSVMAQFKSPFLVHLYWAFQDDQYLYLVMNFMKGGDLRYYLDKHGPMPEATCRFYVAELLLAVEEMNSLGLVYRDLKPENILLDEDGHLRLSDFGLVYDLKNSPDGMTSGEAGTRGYLSPEVLTGRYGFTQDVWSYGITIYELLHQSLPFKSRDEVLSGELRFERDLSPECRSLLRGLLEKHPKNRLGCDPKHKWAAIKKHPWFKGIDWDVAHNRGLKPPYLPEPDVAHCSAVFDLEEQFFGDEKKETFTDEQQARFKNFEYRVDQIAPPSNAYAPTSLGGPSTSPGATNTTIAATSTGSATSPNDKSITNTKSNAGTNNTTTATNNKDKEKTYSATSNNTTTGSSNGTTSRGIATVEPPVASPPAVIAAWSGNNPNNTNNPHIASTAPPSASVSPAPTIATSTVIPPSSLSASSSNAASTASASTAPPSSAPPTTTGTSAATTTAPTTGSGGSPRAHTIPASTSATATTAADGSTPVTRSATITETPAESVLNGEIKHLSIAEEQARAAAASAPTTPVPPTAPTTSTTSATNSSAPVRAATDSGPSIAAAVAPTDATSTSSIVSVVEITPGTAPAITPVLDNNTSSSSPKSGENGATKEAVVIDSTKASNNDNTNNSDNTKPSANTDSTTTNAAATAAAVNAADAAALPGVVAGESTGRPQPLFFPN